MTPNMQGDWLIACNMQADWLIACNHILVGWLKTRTLFGSQLTDSQFAKSQLAGLQAPFLDLLEKKMELN